MALVAYEYDSASENEDEEEENSSVVTNDNSEIFNPQNVSSVPSGEVLNQDITPNSALFSNLPQTKPIVNDAIEGQIEDFIPKSKPIVKDKQKVRITIPSLSEFNDVETEESPYKKQKTLSKGSGLISILPPPVKGSVITAKSFIPNVVNQKKNTNASSSSVKNSLVPNAVRKKAEAKQAALLQKVQQKKRQGSDVESDDDIEMPETFDDEMWEKVCGRPKSKPVIQVPEEPFSQETLNIAPEPEKPYDGLDNQAFKELIGKSKRPVGNIKLIDINEEEILLEKDLWMTKSLTDPEMAPKPEVEDPVDPTRRKKHHITYLAQQAKANEQELQNAWASSKNNRLASRAKYGF